MTDAPKVQQNFYGPVSGVAGNVEGNQIIHAAPVPPPPPTINQFPNAIEVKIFEQVDNYHQNP